MRWTIFTLLPLAIAAVSVRADGDAEKELKTLAGLWSAEIKIKVPEPTGLAPKLPEPMSSVFIYLEADGTAKVNGFDNEATVTLNTSKTPKTVDFEYTSGPLKGRKQHGIYEFKKGKNRELDTWIMVVSDLGQKEADRPKELDKVKGKTTAYTFQRSITRVIE